MLKRLIEVALPLKEVSEQSAREKSIRHGHISTLHIWWARRPLAACRAVVFASLIPDPDDPECPEHFRQLVRTELADSQFKPKDSNGSSIEDTPRNRCLEFIKHLVKWENSNEPTYIEPARKLIKEAHKIFHPDSDSDVPKVLDPFAGGGSIPLEALRLCCEAHAVELNPVAHLIELCTLVYPQKHGKPLPKDRDIPEYIKKLIAHNRSKGKGSSGPGLFDKESGSEVAEADDLIPDVEISEAEYRKNPLAADVKYWGNWVLEKAHNEIGNLYPSGTDGSTRLAYLWAHTLPCPNPACRATVPLIKQLWLAKTSRRKIWISFCSEANTINFKIVQGDHNATGPETGTVQLGAMQCPVCKQGHYTKTEIKEAAKLGLGLQPICVVASSSENARYYDLFDDIDVEAFEKAKQKEQMLKTVNVNGLSVIPDEAVGRDFEWVLKPPMFGLTRWCDQFNSRQTVALTTFASLIRNISGQAENERKVAVSALLTLVLGRLADKCAIQCVWNGLRENLEHVFGRQAIPMSWDYGEVNPFSSKMGGWLSNLDWVLRCIRTCSNVTGFGAVLRGSAQRLPTKSMSIDAIITDPPYYDAVPYADLSDFFYVWHKRCLKDMLPDLYRTPLTPKADEIVQQSEKVTPAERRKKTKDFFEKEMLKAFSEIERVLRETAVGSVMYAHASTSAWEALIRGMLDSGIYVTASWPLHTERQGRLRANESAALASSVTLVCRKRAKDAGESFWDDVRQELREVANERLDFFWEQGIRGADFFISAIGPALSVFGKYKKVVRLSGEEVTVGQFLDEVRALVTGYALNKIIQSGQTGTIDAETRFYVVWKWSYGDAKVPADEAFKLAQALGLDTEMMWDRTGTLEKSGQNVQALAIAKRMRISNLGEPESDGSPGSMIDALHRMCAFRDKGDNQALTEFLARSGHARNETLWVVAQAISEILPDGDKEKQLVQGLLNQRDRIMEAARDAKLF